jgi:hypothetical protein
MSFAVIKAEKTLRIADKTRLNASESYPGVPGTTITLIEIQPEGTALFYDVTTDGYLDWQYTTEEVKTATARVTFSDLSVVNATADLNVLAEANDIIFSDDSDLVEFEDDILDYVVIGRNSFLNIHRKTKNVILAEVANKRILNPDGSKITIDQFADLSELREWSTYMTLKFIFESLMANPGDKFEGKRDMYQEMNDKASSRFLLTITSNIDNTTEKRKDLFTGRLVRR